MLFFFDVIVRGKGSAKIFLAKSTLFPNLLSELTPIWRKVTDAKQEKIKCQICQLIYKSDVLNP